MNIAETEVEGMAAQVAKNKKQTKARAGGNEVEDLPQGSAAVEVSAEEPAQVQESTTDVLADPEVQKDEVAVEADKPAQEEETIRIAGKVFKTQKEAFEYAEKLEQEKLIAEAHAQGVREALAAQQVQAPQTVVEDDFETRFYTDPKKALSEIEERAIAKAEARIDAKIAREKAWNDFLSEFPDIRRQDAEAILNANTDTLGRLPWEEGRKALAQAVYREYDEITNLRRPRTELVNKKPVLSPSGGVSRGVTPRVSEEKPLSFSEQLRKIKSKG